MNVTEAGRRVWRRTERHVYNGETVHVIQNTAELLRGPTAGSLGKRSTVQLRINSWRVSLFNQGHKSHDETKPTDFIWQTAMLQFMLRALRNVTGLTDALLSHQVFFSCFDAALMLATHCYRLSWCFGFPKLKVRKVVDMIVSSLVTSMFGCIALKHFRLCIGFSLLFFFFKGQRWSSFTSACH